MNICPQEIGRRIKDERVKSHRTQDELSEALSIGRVHLANIEAGRKVASIDLLAEIAVTLGCSLDYIVFGINTADAVLKKQLHDAMSLLQSVYDKLQ